MTTPQPAPFTDSAAGPWPEGKDSGSALPEARSHGWQVKYLKIGHTEPNAKP